MCLKIFDREISKKMKDVKIKIFQERRNRQSELWPSDKKVHNKYFFLNCTAFTPPPPPPHLNGTAIKKKLFCGFLNQKTKLCGFSTEVLGDLPGVYDIRAVCALQVPQISVCTGRQLQPIVKILINQSISQSINQSVNQSINQSVNQSINQSINQSNNNIHGSISHHHQQISF